MPLCVYAAQKWAYKCYKELRAIRAYLEKRDSPTTSVK